MSRAMRTKPSLVRVLARTMIESTLRHVSGGAGQRLRYQYYRCRLRGCGRNVRIDEGVVIQNPESIVIGNDVWLLPYSILTGRGLDPIPESRIVRHRRGAVSQGEDEPLLEIGDQTSIGAFNILHGFGGLRIGKRVTTSARVSVYSFSHAAADPERPGLVTYANSMVRDAPVVCIVSPVTLEDGVWIGLGTSVFGGTIGADSFVAAHSVVINDIGPNSYASGNPATRLRPRFTPYEGAARERVRAAPDHVPDSHLQGTRGTNDQRPARSASHGTLR